MTSKTPNETVSGPSQDRIGTGETSVSVADAARILGITEDGVRKALRRGTLAGSKDERGAWRVSIPAQDLSRDRPETDETTAKTGPETSLDTGLLALVDQLRSENTYLREELHNTHILLAQITARIPALTTGDEPPSDPPDAPGSTEAPKTTTDTSRSAPVVDPPKWWEFWRR